VVGAHSVLRRAKQNPEKYPWLTQLLAQRPFKAVAIALANKMARIAWAFFSLARRALSIHGTQEPPPCRPARFAYGSDAEVKLH
jgi:hypothetical protein